MTTHLTRSATSAALFLMALGVANIATAAVPAQLMASTPLPADPGAAGQAALAGVDANRNGVRDDMEPFLHQYFDSKPRLLRAMANTIIGLQATINATTPVQSARAQLMTIHATECLMSLKGQLVTDPSRDAHMVALLVNTPARTAAIAAHQARISSQTFTMRELDEWEPACEMRADLIDNTIALPPTP
jgi:hypothetical protein